MAIHITVVGFGKEPDMSVEARLNHCGFLEGVAGETIQGDTATYTVRTQYSKEVQIFHLVIQDLKIDCRDLALVFAKPFDGMVAGTPESSSRAELMGLILAETAGRCGAVDLVREVEGLFEDPHGNMAYVFKNVAMALENDIADGIRKEIRKRN